MAGGSRIGFGEVGWLVSDPRLVSRAPVAAACRAAARADSSAEGDSCWGAKVARLTTDGSSRSFT